MSNEALEETGQPLSRYITLRYKDRFVILIGPCTYTEHPDGNIEFDFSHARPVGEFFQAEPPSREEIERSLKQRRVTMALGVKVPK